jgi:hypothetical protein
MGFLSRSWSGLPTRSDGFGHSERNWPFVLPSPWARSPLIAAALLRPGLNRQALPKLKGLTPIRFISSYRLSLCLIESSSDIMRRCCQVRACVDWPAPPGLPMHLVVDVPNWSALTKAEGGRQLRRPQVWENAPGRAFGRCPRRWALLHRQFLCQSEQGSRSPSAAGVGTLHGVEL